MTLKYAIVYNPRDHKLISDSYSQTFRGMLLALIEKLKPHHITSSCSVKDVDADVVIFFDPHSTHLVLIKGIADSNKLKYEFMDDPHQIEMFGRHKTTNITFQKLGAGGRIRRALNRNIDYIICPHKESYFKYLSPYLDGKAEEKLVWFPCAPDLKYFINRSTPISKRKPQLLANGATWAFPTFYPYEFRRWAFQQPEVTYVSHYIKDQKTPSGIQYPQFLGTYAGALALSEAHVCPKHLEIPMAGSICFVQHIAEYKELGFEDWKNCIVVNKENFSSKAQHFLKNVGDYQEIADAGRRLAENNYTATHFAQYIKRHAESVLR